MRNAVKNGAEWAGGVGRFYGRWAEIGPGIGPQEEAENTGDFSENEPNGPIGPILGGREHGVGNLTELDKILT